MILRADARNIPLAAESVQCVVTSPPYWGLRSYAGLKDAVWGGDLGHRHEWTETEPREAYKSRVRWQHEFNGRDEQQPDEKCLRTSTTRETRPEAWGELTQGAFCPCGAWCGQLGLEPTLELFVQHIVEVFREVWRVLRDDGTLWLNLGDSYTSGGRDHYATGKDIANSKIQRSSRHWEGTADASWRPQTPPGLKPKDLCGIPWRIALALQADGWYLRADVIWAKRNPMPESVTDRPTRSHEYLFLLAKGERYYYDADAIREPVSGGAHDPGRRSTLALKSINSPNGFIRDKHKNDAIVTQRNKRDVWTVNSEPTPEAHFATFPQKLIEPCILAGSRAADVCFDPFLGSGTVGIVCERMGRRWIGTELSSDYIEIAKKRTAQMGLFGGGR